MNTQRHVLPLSALLSNRRDTGSANDYDVHRFAGDADSLRVRTDWDGDPQNHGLFSVLGPQNTWLACGNLAPDTPLNDLLLPTSKLSGTGLKLHIERGPMHPAVPFEVWAVPIEWNPSKAPGSEPPKEYVATRDIDYVCRPEAGVPKRISELQGHAQVAVLQLRTDVDYELWVKLLHPFRDGVFSLQDPVVSSDGQGGSPPPVL